MIQIFITGGTFDKAYNFLSGGLYFKDSNVPKMLDRGRSAVNVNIKTLMLLDSLDMVDGDREIIAHNCKRAKSNRILITHGTDRVVETAKYLAQHNFKDKTIVLTGAMIPYAFGTSSDGFFNLGSALAFVQMLPPGVYIAMHGRYFNWDNVRKNLKTAYFEEIIQK